MVFILTLEAAIFYVVMAIIVIILSFIYYIYLLMKLIRHNKTNINKK